MATKSEIDKDPKFIQAFCDALAEAQAALWTDRELFVKASVIEFPKVEEPIIRAAAANFFTNTAIPKSPTISKEEWDVDMAFEIAGGSIKGPRPYEEMVDNSFAQKAVDKLKKA
jgi:NitT/TauT family transport system substrate-binding protein